MSKPANASPFVSVVVCSHNSRPDLLERTLAALRAQRCGTAAWELILVDSASRVPTTETVDLSWHPIRRHVREELPGLTRARLRGIKDARGEILVFVDDDNVLDPNYLSEAVRLAREWPMIGAWSGRSIPEFETEPPAWTRRYWGNLVIREVPRDVWSNLPLLPETMPYGAGLCVRRSVARHYLRLHEDGERPDALDRMGDSLVSGGDNDLAACACAEGLGVGVFGSLRLTHLISAGRLDEPYLLRLVEEIAYSGVLLRSYWANDSLAWRLRWRSRVADVLRQLFMSARERRFFRAGLRGQRRGIRHVLQRGPRLRPAAS